MHLVGEEVKMGLSSSERMEQILRAAVKLTRLGRNLPERGNLLMGPLLEESTKALQEKISQVWHTILARDSKGAFWLEGSEVGPHLSEDSLGVWVTAIKAHFELAQSPVKEGRGRPYCGVFRNHLDIKPLLQKERYRGPVLAWVLQVFWQVESLTYPLRRYDDDLRERYAELDRLISDMMGLCHTVFAQCDEYARAYILNRVCTWIYAGDAYFNAYDLDPVAEALVGTHFHTHLKAAIEMPLKDLIALDKWRLTHPSTPEYRLRLAFRIAEGSFSARHDLYRILEASKGMTPRPRKAKLIKAFEKSLLISQAEKRRVRSRDGDMETNEVIHGWWIREEIQNKEGKK